MTYLSALKINLSHFNTPLSHWNTDNLKKKKKIIEEKRYFLQLNYLTFKTERLAD